MKAKEAPEKIWLGKHIPDLMFTNPNSNNFTEYTRTDAFIEKACSWLENNLQGIVGGNIYIEDFINYMKGE